MLLFFEEYSQYLLHTTWQDNTFQKNMLGNSIAKNLQAQMLTLYM